MKFMRAHGNMPGPTERPWGAGALAALVAVFAAIAVPMVGGSLVEMGGALRIGSGGAALILVGLWLGSGALYGRVFSRAAADSGGGWLFGLAFGYILWMLGPATVLQWIAGKPLTTGTSALCMLGGFMLFGLGLGIAYPFTSRVLQAKLNSKGRQGGDEAQTKGSDPAGAPP